MGAPSPRFATFATAVLVSATLGASVSACEETSTGTTQRPKGGSSSGGEDAGSSADPEPDYVLDDGSGSGTTWSDLYADLFGPSGRASCAGEGSSCHASETAEAASSKFVCASESGCRESLRGDSNLVRDADIASPDTAFLISVLRKKRPDGSIRGTQPKSPLFVFHEDSIERIKTWIASGAE